MKKTILFLCALAAMPSIFANASYNEDSDITVTWARNRKNSNELANRIDSLSNYARTVQANKKPALITRIRTLQETLVRARSLTSDLLLKADLTSYINTLNGLLRELN